MLQLFFSRAALLPALGLALLAAGALVPDGNVAGIVLIAIGANVAFISLYALGVAAAWEADSRTILSLCQLSFVVGVALVVLAALAGRFHARIALVTAGLYLVLFSVWTIQQPVSTPYRVLAVGAFILLVFGGMAGYAGWRDWRLFAESQETPQEITLQDLVQNGFTNRHVWLREFRFCDEYATETGKKSHLNTFWIPVVPVDGQAVKQDGPAPPVPPEVRAVVACLALGDPVRPARRAGGVPIDMLQRRQKEAKGYECTVMTGLQSLTPEVRDQLLALAPRTDLDTLIVLNWSKPPSAERVYGLLGAGGAFLVGGLLGLAIVYRRAQTVVGVDDPRFAPGAASAGDSPEGDHLHEPA